MTKESKLIQKELDKVGKHQGSQTATAETSDADFQAHIKEQLAKIKSKKK